MIVELELWHLISLLLAFFGCVAGFFKMLMAQIDKRLDERFDSQDEALTAIRQANHNDATQWQRLDRDMLQLRADLPLHYVRREDYIRGQTVLESKMDGLYTKIENLQLRERAHVG
ncbi:MAG: hypothetical protein ACT4PG_09360 [Panacagrimonas sp.]